MKWLALLCIPSLAAAGVWAPTRNSSSSMDQDYYKASLNDPGEPPSSDDPWASTSGPAMPASPPAPAAAPTPAPAPYQAHPTPTSQTTGKHSYTCDQVANKVLALVTQMMAEKMKDHAAEMANLTEEQLQKIATGYQKEAQVAHAKIVQECNSKDWTDAARACAMNATSFAAATECK